MNARLNQVIDQLNDDYDKFRMNEALMNTYKLVWDDFCAWYLEMVKPPYGEKLDEETYTATIEIFEKILTLLHPFMPFLSEEIWQTIRVRQEGESLCLAQWPVAISADENWLKGFEAFTESVIGIRNIRKDNAIANKEKLVLKVLKQDGDLSAYHPAIEHLGNIEATEMCDEKPAACYSFIVKGREFFIPFTEKFDVTAELKKLGDDLAYTEDFLQKVRVKLTNERFVSNAPQQVLDLERKKEEDAMHKIELLKTQIAALAK
jgi:valyl-tRNA synthetase